MANLDQTIGTPPPRHVCAPPAGADEGDVSTGFVLCSIKDPTPMVSTFECQLVILELLEHNPIFTVGYRCVCVCGGGGGR
jgi:peptide chain release factor subunit 3